MASGARSSSPGHVTAPYFRSTRANSFSSLNAANTPAICLPDYPILVTSSKKNVRLNFTYLLFDGEHPSQLMITNRKRVTLRFSTNLRGRVGSERNNETSGVVDVRAAF